LFFIVKKKRSKYITAGLTILLLATGSLLSHEIDKTAEQESQEVVHNSVRNMESIEEEKNEGQTNNEEEPQTQVEVPADVPDENTQSVQIEEVNATEIVEEETSVDTSEVIENTVTEESPYYYEEVVYDDGSAYKGNFVNGYITDMECSPGQMEINTMVISQMATSMEKVPLHGRMEVFIKGSSEITYRMVTVK
jgi:hypothetical protein